MDELENQTNELRLMAERISLEARKLRFEITPLTTDNLKLVYPVFTQHNAGIVHRFYAFIMRFPEAARLLQGKNLDGLKFRQQRHWETVVTARFDGSYLVDSLTIGFAHFRARIPPHLYMAGYNFFIGDLLRLVSTEFRGTEMAAATTAITKVCMLDMSIALNAYMLNIMIHPEQ